MSPISDFVDEDSAAPAPESSGNICVVYHSPSYIGGKEIRPRFYFVNLSGADEFAASKISRPVFTGRAFRAPVRGGLPIFPSTALGPQSTDAMVKLGVPRHLPPVGRVAAAERFLSAGERGEKSHDGKNPRERSNRAPSRHCRCPPPETRRRFSNEPAAKACGTPIRSQAIFYAHRRLSG